MNRPITATTELELRRLAKRYSKYGFDYDKLVGMYNIDSELSDEATLVMMRFTLSIQFNEEEYFTVQDIALLYDVNEEEVEETIEAHKNELIANGGMVEVSFTPPDDMKGE